MSCKGSPTRIHCRTRLWCRRLTPNRHSVLLKKFERCLASIQSTTDRRLWTSCSVSSTRPCDIGIVFVVGLVVMAMFLISNTIKITIFSRRREIEIMKLVGATNWFIRWPFLTEGIIIGVVGAMLPFVIIAYGYHIAYSRLGGTFLAVAFPLIPTTQLAQILALVMFGLGIVIGVWGGIMSVRKFLKI